MSRGGPRATALSDQIAVVGVGNTDYRADYARARNNEFCDDGYGYAAAAFRAALADACLDKASIDGLIVGPTLAHERTAEILGLDVRWSSQGDAVNAVIQGVLAIATGMANFIALVYGNNQRTAGVRYGGPNSVGDRFLSYVYYAPWGMTSQGALYALMMRRYIELWGLGNDDLAPIPIGQREFARLNPAAVMQKPLSADGYRMSTVIVDPLRLYDYCLVNDGGVALILTTLERARDLPHPVVTVAGLAKSDLNCDATSLRPRLIDFYHPAHIATAEKVYAMAGIGTGDVDSLQIYDSFSCHILFALEGLGFCGPGDAVSFIREKGIGPGGRMPINTSGGMLSESYMQGWNHQVEAVRQLRGECGPRQVPDCRHVQYSSDVAGKAASVIYRRS
jgi:acetyl-CoA acetyltransferase